jgi:hypothetical protein
MNVPTRFENSPYVIAVIFYHGTMRWDPDDGFGSLRYNSFRGTGFALRSGFLRPFSFPLLFPFVLFSLDQVVFYAIGGGEERAFRFTFLSSPFLVLALLASSASCFWLCLFPSRAVKRQNEPVYGRTIPMAKTNLMFLTAKCFVGSFPLLCSPSSSSVFLPCSGSVHAHTTEACHRLFLDGMRR